MAEPLRYRPCSPKRLWVTSLRKELWRGTANLQPLIFGPIALITSGDQLTGLAVL
jgi:hypothetical protein